MPQRLIPAKDNVSMSQAAVAPLASRTFRMNRTWGFCQCISVTSPSSSLVSWVSNQADTL